MKKLIIASAILSSSAMAAIEPTKFSFVLDSGVAQSCTLAREAYGEANLGIIGQPTDSNNSASARVNSNLVNKITFESYGGWVDVSAWSGNEPNFEVESSVWNKFESKNDLYTNQKEFIQALNAGGGFDVDSYISMKVLADSPTSVGRGQYDVMVHIECE